MRKNNTIVFVFLLFSLSFITKAQKDSLIPLGGNSVLINYKQKNNTNTHSQKASSANGNILPFFDDFSYFSSYPDPAKWVNSQSVFVNHTFPIAPPTIGVATFDGLNRFGYPYNPAITTGNSTGSVLSDSLISVPLRLDTTVIPSDSLYLSFYYQAKGRGDVPEQGDELQLYFKDSLSQTWPVIPIWTRSGYNPNATDTNFHRVMIPIYAVPADSSHFTSQFQFMFRNKSTQCGSIDHWHIDLVYLNKRPHNTSPAIADTIIDDVSFVYDEPSLLKNYMQMPFNQFSGAGDMKSNINAFIRNNKSGVVNITTSYRVLDNVGNVFLPEVTNGSSNVTPYRSGGYCNNPGLIDPSLNNFTYGAGPFPDSTSYLFKFYIGGNSSSGVDTLPRNDTAYFRQNFSNYYSYDDGTAEAGYYINAVGAQTAVKYKINIADSLRCLDIFFDPVINVNLLQNSNIHMVVWADNGGHPGTPLLVDTFPHPHTVPYYSHAGYNIFQRYQLSKPVFLPAGTTFYIGVFQELNIGLGIGYDRNTDTHTNVFYYDPPPNGTGWHQSTISGSLMIHPVLGDPTRAVNVQSLNTEKEIAGIYPNPATGEIFIRTNNKITKIIITDLPGNILLEKEISTSSNLQITLPSLPNGLYLLRTFNNRELSSTQKLIISH